jgi:hypothetical protein
LDTVEIEFTIDATADTVEVYASYEADDNFNLIASIPGEDWSGSDKVVDASFNRKTTIYYRIYIVRWGVRSLALTDSIALALDASAVTSLTVAEDMDHFSLDYVLPTERKFSHVTITRHAEADSGDLLEGSASEIYSGSNNHLLYSILGADIDKYHQFWVTTVTRT